MDGPLSQMLDETVKHIKDLQQTLENLEKHKQREKIKFHLREKKKVYVMGYEVRSSKGLLKKFNLDFIFMCSVKSLYSGMTF